MFSGIIEDIARVERVVGDRGSVNLTFSCSFVGHLRVDQSVAHNGVCLTVVAIQGETYTVTAIAETLEKSNLGELQVGDLVNVERAMRPDKLLDGHIVQGHVDTTARCVKVVECDGSWRYTFKYEPQDKGGYVTVEKGSVTVNGVSLTVCDSGLQEFSVAIIPYTFEHTNFHTFCVGSIVNLEFDIIGKYIARFMEVQQVQQAQNQ